MDTFKKIGLLIIFLWFMGGGVYHFIGPEFFTSIMPDYIPWHLELVYISGVFEILGAIGILIPKFRQLAGNCLILLVFCVTPVNVHMWLNPQLFPDVPETFLTVRLIVQVALVALIWWSTRTPEQA